MPVHDWTRVDAGTFHHFHNGWIMDLSDALNAGLLPEGYYAMSEQHAGRVIADVLTLHTGDGPPAISPGPGSVAAVTAPPRVERKLVASPNATYRTLRRTLAIRHVSNHRVIALIEVVSPANKDRESSVVDFVEKAHAALSQDCHLLVADLFPPGPHDPAGLHGAIWESFSAEEDIVPIHKPLTLAAYVAGPLPEAYLQRIGVGDTLPDMPLFLEPGWYVNVPLETTYSTAYRGMPAFWRGVLEGRATPP